MTWALPYLLIWLLILGAAVAYAVDDYVELRVCSRHKGHELYGVPLFIRRSAIMMFRDDGGAVKSEVCTTMMLINGNKIFIQGSVDEMHEMLDEERNK